MTVDDSYVSQVTLPDNTSYDIKAVSWVNDRTIYTSLNTSSTTATINGGNEEIAVEIGVDGVLPVKHGGTNATAVTPYGIAYGSTSGTAFSFTSAGSAGQIIIGSDDAPIWYNGLTLTGTTANNYTADFGGKILFTDGTSTTATYGNEYTPIYWNDGKPDVVHTVTLLDFEFNSGSITSSISSSAIAINTAIILIAVTNGIESLNGKINASITSNKITLTSTTATNSTSGAPKVSGYIIISQS